MSPKLSRGIRRDRSDLAVLGVLAFAKLAFHVGTSDGWGYFRDELGQWFEHVKRVATIRCQDCVSFQNDVPIHVARGRKVSLDELWSQLREFI